MRQLLYTMFISNNRALSHSWWKENLVKHQNVPIYYEKWLPAKFSLAFCVFIKRSICLNESCLGQNLLYLIFLKNVLISSWKSFNFKFQPQWKDLKSSYQARPILAVFCNLIALSYVTTVWQAFELTKLSSKLNLKEYGASQKQKQVSRDNHLQNIWD